MEIDQLRTHIAGELLRWRVPGLELAVVRNQQVLLADGFGLRDVEQNLPVTPHTLFYHGSTCKAFTGVLVGTLVDDGLLEWDRPVREYLADFRVHDSALTERITVTDLLSHRSGLTRHEWVWLANPSASIRDLVHRLRYLESNLQLRATFEYSNLAYMVIGHLVAEVTGSSWHDQMGKRVLEPLGMRHTVTSVTEAQLREHAEAHGRPANGTGDRAVIPWREADQVAPAGQMIACATDIAQWLKLQLSDGEIAGAGNGSGPRRVISAASLAMTTQIHTPVNSPGPDPDMYFYGYGCGWMIGAYRGRRLVWHNGGIDGFKTDIALLPDDGIAVAASCNVLETSLPFALAFHIVDALLGEPPKPWSDTLMSAEGSSPAPESPEAVPSTQPSHSLLAYAGTYRHPGYGTVSVEVQGGELRVCLGELEVVSRYRHYDTWTVTYEPLDSHWPLTFLTDADGRIHAAEIPLEPSIKPIRFEAVAKETDV